MPVIVSLLRGVNLAGRRKVKMDALRELYNSAGMRDVQTYIQSGNVICRAPARGLAGLAKRLESAFEAAFGFQADIVVRTTEEMRAVLARNPFAGRSDIEPAKLLIHFLTGDPDPAGCEAVRGMVTAPEELQVDGRHLFVYYANGLARPKLPWPKVVRALATGATGRNVTTVQKLLSLAEQMEASR